MAFNSTPSPGDTILTKYKKILANYQNQGGALSANNPAQTDTRRRTMVKIIRAINGTTTGS